MSCVLLAERTILVHFDTIRIVLLVLNCVVISLLTFCTCECNFYSHFLCPPFNLKQRAESALASASEKAEASARAKTVADKAVADAAAAAALAKTESEKAVASVATFSDSLKEADAAAKAAADVAKAAADAATASKAIADKALEDATAAESAAKSAKDSADAAKSALDKAAADKAQADKAAKALSMTKPSSGPFFFFSGLNGSYSAEFEPRVPSAENLESAIDSLVELLDRDVEDLEMIPDFEDGCIGVRREANSLAVVALVLGASDVESKRKASAPSLIKVAQALSSAESADEVKAAYKALGSAKAETGDSVSLKWKKVALLKPLMKNAIPAFSTEIKRLSRNEKTFLRAGNSKKVVDKSTIMFCIALGCRENVDETQAPDEEKLWREYCDKLASATLEFNEQANAVASGKGSFDEMKAAYKAVEETCNSTCHEKFGGKSAE